MPTDVSDGSAGRAPLAHSVTYTPDYQALIQSDPAYMALEQMLSAQGTQDTAARQAATAQQLIQFGDVPDFSSAASSLGLSPEALQMLQQDLADPNIANLAHANTGAGLSTEAQLQHGQSQALMSLRNALAARGALSSGDDAYRTNQQNQTYAEQQNAALKALLASIGGYQQNYLNARTNEQGQLQSGLETAQAFEAGLPQNQALSLTYNAKTGVYTDASGNTYTPTPNRDGTWTLKGNNGASYILGSDGKLTNVPVPVPVAPPPPDQGPEPPPSPPVPINLGYGHNPNDPPPAPAGGGGGRVAAQQVRNPGPLPQVHLSNPLGAAAGGIPGINSAAHMFGFGGQPAVPPDSLYPPKLPTPAY